MSKNFVDKLMSKLSPFLFIFSFYLVFLKWWEPTDEFHADSAKHGPLMTEKKANGKPPTFLSVLPKKINLVKVPPVGGYQLTKLIRTDTTLDLSQRLRKADFKVTTTKQTFSTSTHSFFHFGTLFKKNFP